MFALYLFFISSCTATEPTLHIVAFIFFLEPVKRIPLKMQRKTNKGFLFPRTIFIDGSYSTASINRGAGRKVKGIVGTLDECL